MAPDKKRRMIWQPVHKKTSPTASSSSFASCGFGPATSASDEVSTSPTASEVSEDPVQATISAQAEESACAAAAVPGPLEVPSARTSSDKYSKGVLLSARRVMLQTQAPCKEAPGRLKAQRVPFSAECCTGSTPTSPNSSFSPTSSGSPSLQAKVGRSISDPGLPRLPPASPNSWALAQRQRRSKTQELEADGLPFATAAASSEDIGRSVKGILNKLTPEKFSTLYAKLLESGAAEAEHMELLARAVFDEAVLQHKFSAMYADLCMFLLGDLSADHGAALSAKVMSLCLDLLGQSLERSGEDVQRAGSDLIGADETAQALHKKRALGNVRFMGELLIRNVLPAHVLFDCTNQFIAPPSAEHKLEMLAALLTVVGPVLDTAMWPQHAELVPVFWHVRGLTFDTAVSKRVRCLLRDVVELRDAMWIDGSSGKQQDRPMMLEEVRQNGAFQDGHAASVDWIATADFSDSAFNLWDAGGSMDFMPTFSDEGIPMDFLASFGSEGVPMASADSSTEFMPQGFEPIEAIDAAHHCVCAA